MNLTDKYAFQQEINARIDLTFDTPLQSFSFYDTAFLNVQKLNASREDKIISWDDEGMLDLVRNLAKQRGYLID